MRYTSSITFALDSNNILVFRSDSFSFYAVKVSNAVVIFTHIYELVNLYRFRINVLRRCVFDTILQSDIIL
jgi:hypothetical protein